MSWPFSYVLADEALEVRFGRWNARRVAYSDMESVRDGLALINEHWTNPWPLRFLTIRRRTGWLRNFVINPDDRGSFSSELSARIAKAPR
jgi:hypothetical protein